MANKVYIKGLIISLVFFILGCNFNGAPDKPDKLLSKEQMADIITEVAILKSATGVNKVTLEKTIHDSEHYIYKKFNIDSTVFAQNNTYYAYHVKDYEAIYNDVTARLTKLKTKLKAQDEKEKVAKKIADSLKKNKKDSLFKEQELKEGLLETEGIPR